MKTNLKVKIKTSADADNFIRNLHNHYEIWHFDDDPRDCLPDITEEEAEELERIFEEIDDLKNYDPFEIAVTLVTSDSIAETIKEKDLKKLDKVLTNVMDQLIDQGYEHEEIKNFLFERALKNI